MKNIRSINLIIIVSAIITTESSPMFLQTSFRPSPSSRTLASGPFEPHCFKDDLKHVQWRELANSISPSEAAKKNPNVSISNPVLENYRSIDCFRYAFMQITQFYEPIDFPGYGCGKSIKIEDFFEQIPRPVSNCLTVYGKEMKHFAIHIENGKYQSKWGNFPEEIKHDDKDVPAMYGNTIYFFKLKEHYENDNNQLIKDIRTALLLEEARKR